MDHSSRKLSDESKVEYGNEVKGHELCMGNIHNCHIRYPMDETEQVSEVVVSFISATHRTGRPLILLHKFDIVLLTGACSFSRARVLGQSRRVCLCSSRHINYHEGSERERPRPPALCLRARSHRHLEGSTRRKSPGTGAMHTTLGRIGITGCPS